MLGRGALHPIEALRHRKAGCRFMGGEVVGEANHAVCTGTAASAGDRDLGGKATAGQSTRASGNAVFAKCDGMVLELNSWNHG